MKHFEIDFFVINNAFTYKCSTAYEALEAIKSINVYSHHDLDMDKVMTMLFDIKNGNQLSHTNYIFAVRYVDGEV